MSHSESARIREIPYNYTSYSDREIVIRFLGEDIWSVIEKLRHQRRTGQSARMLFEILGDMWIVRRNPYLQDDLLLNHKRRKALIQALEHRLDQIKVRAGDNKLALQLIAAAEKAISDFTAWFPQHSALRQEITQNFSTVTAKENIDFSGLARVSHVTDASDWRVEYPAVVIFPSSERELPDIVKTCEKIGLTIIARGGGTGYTGGAVPLLEKTAVINLEKLDTVSRVRYKQLSGLTEKVAVIKAGAGAVTRSVAVAAENAGHVFAVDPTSQDSSTIGGNIAMNAGGKKAVLWGTTLDNLVSWTMVNAKGDWLEIERLNHNLGKIHEQEWVEFKVSRFDSAKKNLLDQPNIIKVKGKSLRKEGLGKDVTDKFLAGIPGVQKEGCDGIISSAEFILHQYQKTINTVCIEFFNSDLKLAVPSIVEIKKSIDLNSEIMLTGLEHLDERYIKAVDYTSKATRPHLPKMVLLLDISSEHQVELDQAIASIQILLKDRDAELFIAKNRDARHQFWADRGRTAAIAAHTNAFKINEDVVIPLDKLADYSEGIEAINIEYSLANKIKIVNAILAYLDSKKVSISTHAVTVGVDAGLLADSGNENIKDDLGDLLNHKIKIAQSLCLKILDRWQLLLESFSKPVSSLQGLFSASELEDLVQKQDANVSVFHLLRLRLIRPSFRLEIATPLQEYFSGQDFSEWRLEFERLHTEIRSGRLFVATHMHAGDGNVHTNIPVNSNDYEMMRSAEGIVDQVMVLAQSLGGVISGEHGIGMTKIRYLDQENIDAFDRYNRKMDSTNLFNRNKLSLQGGLDGAYTPSLRLLQQEAIILEESELGDLNNAVRHCLRCGKCKPVCNTHVPRANLNYSPRNKILATGLIIEAFLYEEQTRRGLSTRHFEELNDIADHCTICHKCLAPCPVNIDFGDVTVLMRHILRRRGQRRSNWGTFIALLFLNVTRPRWIKLLRILMIKMGYPMQRLAYHLFPNWLFKSKAVPKPTSGKMKLSSQLVNFVAKPLPAKTPAKPLRSIFKLDDSKYVPVIRDLNKVNDQSQAVFYFPGCGSERLFSQVGLATLAILYDLGVYTVLPPGYLCCGYPQTSSGYTDKGKAITVENRVLFHRVANTLNYLDINTVLVSCGTCLDQLQSYEFKKIFPGSELMDIHEYMVEANITLEGTQSTEYLYHDPCHSPMKRIDPIKVASSLMGKKVKLSDRCCGEAGTFAISRPDIASQIRYRKQEELEEGVKYLVEKQAADVKDVKILTACPSCQQGLSGYEPTTGLSTDYIIVELMKHKFGKNWQADFIKKINDNGIERVLL